MRRFLTQLGGYAHPAVSRSPKNPPERPAPRRPEKLSGAQAIARILATVGQIPEGRVATYGQVAFLAGLPGHARQVGFALRGLPEGSAVPWHRVVNAQGEISSRDDPAWEGFQRHLLEEEGVSFQPKGERGRIDLERYAWDPEPGIRPSRKRR